MRVDSLTSGPTVSTLIQRIIALRRSVPLHAAVPRTRNTSVESVMAVMVIRASGTVAAALAAPSASATHASNARHRLLMMPA